MNTDYVVVLDGLKEPSFGNPLTLHFEMPHAPSTSASKVTNKPEQAVLVFMVQVTEGSKNMQLRIKLSGMEITTTAGWNGPEFHTVHEVFDTGFLSIGKNKLEVIADPNGVGMGEIKISDIVIWYKWD